MDEKSGNGDGDGQQTSTTETDQIQTSQSDTEKKSETNQVVTNDSPKPKRKLSKKSKIILLALVLIIAVGAGVAAYVFTRKEKPAPSSNQTPQPPAPQPAAKETSKLPPELEKFVNPTTGEVWLSAPKKIANQNFSDNDVDSQPEYYEVGTRNGATIIMRVLSDLGDNITLYEKKGSVVTFIARPDANATYNEQDETNVLEYSKFKPNVKIDKTSHYDSLSRPQKLPVGQNQFANRTSYGDLGNLVRPLDSSNKAKETVVATFGKSKLMKSEYSYADTGLTSSGYYVVLPINVRSPYLYEPVATDLSKYKWSKGESYTSDTIDPIARGCGGGSGVSVTVSDKTVDNDLEESGVSSDGVKTYRAKSLDNTILTKGYEEFMQFIKDSAEDASLNQYRENYTKQKFNDQHGVIFVKDGFSRWLVYGREKLRPAYGCAKPVVYLYPQTISKVKVKVGANVTISDPLYDPIKGWEVTAFPNGQILHNGLPYKYLFWEGKGISEYPGITTGTVVRSSEAIGTIKSQMAQMGFNDSEIGDFVEYWQPLLPSKPFTRLTWLDTADMNRMAPLNISPKPDTVLRAFLDYSGLDAPIDLPAQQLQKVARRGFTVTEWGGLGLSIPQK